MCILNTFDVADTTEIGVAQGDIGPVLALHSSYGAISLPFMKSSEAAVLILDVEDAALTPDSDTGGASLSFEILEIGFYSGLTSAGEWSSLLSGPERFSPFSITGIHLDQLRKRAPQEYFKCKFIIHSFNKYIKTILKRRLAVTHIGEG